MMWVGRPSCCPVTLRADHCSSQWHVRTFARALAPPGPPSSTSTQHSRRMEGHGQSPALTCSDPLSVPMTGCTFRARLLATRWPAAVGFSTSPHCSWPRPRTLSSPTTRRSRRGRAGPAEPAALLQRCFGSSAIAELVGVDVDQSWTSACSRRDPICGTDQASLPTANITVIGKVRTITRQAGIATPSRRATGTHRLVRLRVSAFP